jgi:prepilin-type N-terminal cleavage/methylation domain-containing protein
MSTDHSVDTQSTHPAATRLQRGFTLIELVIVLAVLGALAAIAVPQLTGLQQEAELAGTAAVVSSELSNEFARQLASTDEVDSAFSTNITCGDLKSLSPAISGSNEFELSENSGVEITVPSYNSVTNTVSSTPCYLSTI